MSDSREPASTNVPEWRRNAIPSGNSLSTRQFAERPKVTARWKDHRFIGENLSEVQARSPWEQPTGPTPEVSLESLGSDIVCNLTFLSVFLLLEISHRRNRKHSQKNRESFARWSFLTE
jgi:hypothetical protein